ncbi:hypothetical protein D039_1396B, partial [Vibrio parahaemolyticus EKP-028]
CTPTYCCHQIDLAGRGLGQKIHLPRMHLAGMGGAV